MSTSSLTPPGDTAEATPEPVGLVTRLGPIDIVLQPKGFEDGYLALVPRSTKVRRGDVEIRVGALGDLVRSKELLGRDKDIEHPGQLYEQHPELAAGRHRSYSPRCSGTCSG